MLAVGVRYSEVSTANYAIPEKPDVIHVDATRTTSAGTCRPTSASTPTPGCSSTACSPTPHAIRRPADPALVKQIAAASRASTAAQTRTAQITARRRSDGLPRPASRDASGPEELIFVDVTASTHWASEAIEVGGPRRYFTPANNQSMGWAIPASIGAQRVRPDRRVACVTGDGCFLMSGLEASTAARAGLPVKFFVLDDGAYHYMQMLQEPTYRRTTATEIARLDFAAFARGLGAGLQLHRRQRRHRPRASPAPCACPARS